MYCSKCGARNPDGATRCDICGAALRQERPAAAPVAAADAAPASNLVLSILVTLFCCMPFGVVAIVYSAMAAGRAGAGDYEGALRASAQAKTWIWLALGRGLAVDLAWLAMFALGSTAGFH